MPARKAKGARGNGAAEDGGVVATAVTTSGGSDRDLREQPNRGRGAGFAQ